MVINGPLYLSSDIESLNSYPMTRDNCAPPISRLAPKTISSSSSFHFIIFSSFWGKYLKRYFQLKFNVACYYHDALLEGLLLLAIMVPSEFI